MEFLNEMKKSDSINFRLSETNDNNEIINYFDISNWLTEESNSKLDKASMLNSIEARVPFQDRELIEDYFNIDINKKINLFSQKIPLKRLKFLPKYIVNRKKLGWFSPESFFLRKYLKKLFIETFEKNKINNQKIFNYTSILDIFEKHNNGSYLKKELITILTFQIWYDQVINLD
jgi:asparagine synthase (glutamine-hydrolysing)